MEEKIYSVYIHINNVNGKVYIGITRQNPLKRWLNGKGYIDNKHFYRSIKKYGWDNFEHKVIKDNLSKYEAEDMEIKLIKEFQSFKPEYGYNISLGGSHNGKHSEQTRKKLSEVQYKEVFCYDRNTGKYVCSCKSTLHAEEKFGIPNSNISSICLGKMKTAHGYYFSYINYGYNLPYEIYAWINLNDCETKVAQYDLDGNFINEFKSLSDANKYLFGENTNKRVSMINKISYGYIWKYIIDDNYKNKLSDDELNNKKTYLYKYEECYQYDLNGKFIKSYFSASDAAKQINSTQGNISACCRKEIFQVKGYIWRYAKNEEYGKDLDDSEIRKLKIHGLSKNVLQYNKNGDFIREYMSITDASNILHIPTTNICKCCNKKLKSIGGYIFRYSNNPLQECEIKELNINNRKRKVSQYDINMNYINTYNSVAEASRKTKCRDSSIINCCKGLYKHSGNFIWRYEE